MSQHACYSHHVKYLLLLGLSSGELWLRVHLLRKLLRQAEADQGSEILPSEATTLSLEAEGMGTGTQNGPKRPYG